MADRADTSKRSFVSFLLVFIVSLVSVDSRIFHSAAQGTHKITLVIMLLLREENKCAFEHYIPACTRNVESFLFSAIFRSFKCAPGV